jgi:hypothetical protein
MVVVPLHPPADVLDADAELVRLGAKGLAG